MAKNIRVSGLVLALLSCCASALAQNPLKPGDQERVQRALERQAATEQVVADRQAVVNQIVDRWASDTATQPLGPGWEQELRDALQIASPAQLLDARHSSSYEDLRRALLGKPLGSDIRLAVAGIDAPGDADLVFVAMTPCRVIDTRLVGGWIAPGVVRSFVVSGSLVAQGGNPSGCGVPTPDPAAVAITLTAVNITGSGNLRAWPFGDPMPLASVINYGSGNIANTTILPICQMCGADFSIWADGQGVDLVADVVGYFATSAAAGTITGVWPQDASSGLSGGADAGTAYLSLLRTCSPNQTLKWNGGAWGCADDELGQSITAGAGLVLSGSQIRVNFSGSGSADLVARGDHHHNASYLSVAGGIMTGPITFAGSQTISASAIAGQISDGQISGISGSKVAGTVPSATSAATAVTANSVLNGVYTTGIYADPIWITSLAASKISGSFSKAQLPASTAFQDQANTFTAGRQDFSGAGSTLPVKAVLNAATPATCVASKELLLKTDAAPGQQLFICNAAGNAWNLVGDGGGGAAVTSFNGRTGPVVSQTGDYTFAQIGGTASLGQLPGTVLNSGTTYSDPAWLTSLAGGKISGAVGSASAAANADMLDNVHSTSFFQKDSSGRLAVNIGSASGNAVTAISNSPNGTAVNGQANMTGVEGDSYSTNGNGVYGTAWGSAAVGVRGESYATSGQTYGVYGISQSTDGAGVYGGNMSTGTMGYSAGVTGSSSGANGTGVRGVATGNGYNVGVVGFTNSALGVGGQFVNAQGGNILIGTGPGGIRVRIDGTGKGFFNGGFQTGGADFAESVEPTPDSGQLEPGDVLVIARDGQGAVAPASEPYSSRVAGVYSTKPGLLATPYDMDDPRLTGRIPMAVVGIVPCKVSSENGVIEIGDLLVTSATVGHAMKGTDRMRMLGAIVGKALEPLRSGMGIIRVLVTLQ